MKFQLLFAWYDFWIGLFYDQKKNWLYFLPLPMCGIIIKLPQRRYWIYSERINAVVGSTVKSELEHETKEGKRRFIPYWAANGETAPLFGKNYNEE